MKRLAALAAIAALGLTACGTNHRYLSPQQKQAIHVKAEKAVAAQESEQAIEKENENNPALKKTEAAIREANEKYNETIHHDEEHNVKVRELEEKEGG